MALKGFKMHILVRTALLGVAVSAASNASARQIIEVAERGVESISALEISCQNNGNSVKCAISGTHIFHSATKPSGAISDPAGTCYVETALNEDQTFERVGGLLFAKEGPAGSICMTQLLTTIDLMHKVYTTRKFSDFHEGDFCAAQLDETHVYTSEKYTAPMSNLKCNSVEFVPSLWAP